MKSEESRFDGADRGVVVEEQIERYLSLRVNLNN